MRRLYRIILFVWAVSWGCWLQAAGLSPIAYGLLSAQDGQERFNILYKTHQDAISQGTTVDYAGLTSIDLVIPENAKSIPLTDKTDFYGVEFHVLNTEKDFCLFSLTAKGDDYAINKASIRKGQYLADLADANVLLSISDDSLWVKNRIGYSYGATRRDLIVVKNGKLQNDPIMPYNNEYSSPKCKMYRYTNSRKSFGGIKLVRDKESTRKTYLLKVEGQYNVSISDVEIITPANDLYADEAIQIFNSARIRFKNVVIEGTYSRTNKYGYGLSMNNVYDVSFEKLRADGAWGVFGTNNMHKVTLSDCDINRFDVHCYGRDITCKNCTFRNMYNQFSSVYGTVRFSKCLFDKAIPVLIEYSYNAYTGFDLIFEKCKYILSDKSGRNYIVDAGYLDDAENSRSELREKCWPNICINGLEIDVPDGVKDMYLMKIRKSATCDKPLGYVSFFKLNKISFRGSQQPQLVLSNCPIRTSSPVRVTQRNTSRYSVKIIDNISSHYN